MKLSPSVIRNVSAVICIGGMIWLLSDRHIPIISRMMGVTAIAGIGFINQRDLLEEQQEEFLNISKLNKESILDQAVITVPDKSEEVVYPTVFATEYQDPNGIARAIQTILDTMKLRTYFNGYRNAARFERFLLGVNLESNIPQFDKVAKTLHLTLPQFNVALETPPIVGVNNGLLTIDLPKRTFKAITYSQSSRLIEEARNNRQRIIGIDFNGELVTEDINEFNAFTTVGGMTRSGKSVWMRQDCLEKMLMFPNGTFYLIERKEGTFSIFEGCSQLIGSVAYDTDSASELIYELYSVLQERIQDAKLLTGIERKKFSQWCFENPHCIYFDEYTDDEKYTSILANEIFKKGAAYGISGVIGTQMHNRTTRNGGSTVSPVLLEQSSTKLCFKVETPIASMQIIQNTDGKDLLGLGDVFYKSSQKFGIERLQTVFYTDDELEYLCGMLKYGEQKTIISNSNQLEPIDNVPKYVDLTQKYIKPITTEWRILQYVRDSGSKNSPSVIARELGLTRSMEFVNYSLDLFYQNKLIHREKSTNGKSWVYFR